MAKKKRETISAINTSYTLFLIASTVTLSWLASRLFYEVRVESFAVILLYAFIFSLSLYAVRQFFSAGYAFALYCIIFIFLPSIAGLMIGQGYMSATFVVVFASTALAAVIEMIYERFKGSRRKKNFIRTLLGIDRTIDHAAFKTSRHVFIVNEWQGFAVMSVLSVAYLLVVFWLFR